MSSTEQHRERTAPDHHALSKRYLERAQFAPIFQPLSPLAALLGRFGIRVCRDFLTRELTGLGSAVERSKGVRVEIAGGLAIIENRLGTRILEPTLHILAGSTTTQLGVRSLEPGWRVILPAAALYDFLPPASQSQEDRQHRFDYTDPAARMRIWADVAKDGTLYPDHVFPTVSVAPALEL